MTPEELARALHPPRLPERFTAMGLDDLLAAFGVGLLLAALVTLIVMPALRKRPKPLSIGDRIKAASTLPAPERLLALTRLLAETGTPLPDAQREALYRGEAGDPAQIEALIRAGSGRKPAKAAA